MTQLVDPNDIHTAIDTWSGFVYQGKVALYHVLTLLNANPDNENSLQLDSLEDFAIVNAAIEPLTLHQVKAVKSTYYSAYQEAFEKLEKRIDDFPCDAAYFHLAKENEVTAEEIKKKHPKMKVYKYDDDNYYCSLDDINEKNEGQITLYFTTHGFEHYTGNESITRSKLEKIIFDQVIEIHSSNHKGTPIRSGAYYQLIKLFRFKAILEENPTDNLNEAYYLYLTKESINSSYTEFSLRLEEILMEQGETISEDDKNKLESYIKQINSLDERQLIEFIRSILPHRKVKYDNILSFKDHNIQKDEFKRAYLKSLYQLIASESTVVDGLVWNDNNKKQYRATAINDGNDSLWEVCKDIYDNVISTDLGTLYQTDYLITSDLEGNIEKTLNKQFDVGEREDKNNVNKWSNISLIKRNDAKTNIND